MQLGTVRSGYRGRRIGLIAACALIAAAVLPVSAALAAAPCPGAAVNNTSSCTFTAGGTYTATVPVGVTSLNVIAVGAAGGGGGVGVVGGGAGASVRDTAVPVTAGEALSVVVGLTGQAGSNDPATAGGPPAAGGAPGGGNGGELTEDDFSSGGGGGGYSGVFDPSGSPLVIAGGGGGSGEGNARGGDGDTGAGGVAGGSSDDTSNPAAGGAGGVTSSGTACLTGGAGGLGVRGGAPGTRGTYLKGGAGGASNGNDQPPIGNSSGGGGGGGYCGGGGGGGDTDGTGGGGGSSYGVGPGLSSGKPSTGPASVTITFGYADCANAVTSSPSTCGFTGAGTYPFTVPSEVLSVDVVAVGAAGGDAGVAYYAPYYSGAGASVEDASVPVTGGDVLSVTVGAEGEQGAESGQEHPGGPTGMGGAPGGGAGGAAGAPMSFDGSYGGGGGGGYSGVFNSADVPLVIAGGGGGEVYGSSIPAGNGDIGSGGEAGETAPGAVQGGEGGVTTPGTACATGGAGGPGTDVPNPYDISQGLPGSNGSYLQGGAGGEGGVFSEDEGQNGVFVASGSGGGGGGGGYCGGGGGGGQAGEGESQEAPTGGGGGSSYGADAGLSNEFNTLAPASVQINYVALTTAPVLSTTGGAAQVGNGLAVTSGTWRSADAPTYSYQWQRCDGTGSGCVDVNDPAADPTTYTLTGADAGHVMQVVVTATDKGMRSAVASNQSAVIAKAAPAITATAGGPLVAGNGAWSDAAVLSGGVAPTGEVSFDVYRAADTSCTTPVATASAVVSGADTYASPAFTPAGPSAAGTYEIVASYSGDAGNAGVATGCADPAGSVAVSQATPAIANAPVSAATVGQHVSDSVTLSGGPSATGTITFSLYGPGDPTCTGSPVTSMSTVSGNGTYQSDSEPVTAQGTYEWTAAYSGDAGNASATTHCGDASFVVGPASPTLSTTPSATTAIGTTFHDTATLSGGYAESGTITFDVYGPADTTCTGPAVFSSTTVPSGDGSYDSGDFTPTILGTYRLVVSFAGDSNNLAVSNACGDETVDVEKAQPTLSTRASPDVVVGGGATFTDTATLGGGDTPSGGLVFRLYGPGDADCAQTPVFVSAAVSVTGAGHYTSPAFTPTLPGGYEWVASYSGDADNSAVQGSCADVSEASSARTPVGGSTGPSGTSGSTGSTGSSGTSGASGASGLSGATGVTGTTGSTGATGGRGIIGGVRVSRVFLRRHGWVSARLVVVVPGTVSLVVTGPGKAATVAARASRRIVIGRRRLVVRRAERVTVRVRLTRRGRMLLAGDSRAALRLSVRFIPAGGRPRQPRTYRVRRSHRSAKH